jgi:pimeloyl-ACP methyl ester carboxylesterase
MRRQDGLPRDPRVRYHFKTKPFEFMFQWILGSCSNGGAEIGEVMYAAAQITEGDGESWYRAFTEAGERVLTRAGGSLEARHTVSAREGLLRAYVYFRSAPLFLSPRDDKRYRGSYERARECFRRAAGLLDPALEEVEVEFDSTTLPGYFAAAEKASSDERHAPTLLMIGGGDTFVEDLYFYIVPQATRRGYHVLFVDLPGQGALPWRGLPMTAQAERPVGAAIDYLGSRNDVDMARLAVYGISGGGYLAPRAAAFEPRIRALVACSVVLDLTPLWSHRLLGLSRSPLGIALRLLKPRFYRSLINLVDTYRWRWGAKTNEELLRVSSDFTVDPRLVRCPTLNIVAQQEYEDFGPTRQWAERCLKDIDHETSKLVVSPGNEGADSHAVGTNLRLVGQVVFDWLDEVLA